MCVCFKNMNFIKPVNVPSAGMERFDNWDELMVSVALCRYEVRPESAWPLNRCLHLILIVVLVVLLFLAMRQNPALVWLSVAHHLLLRIHHYCHALLHFGLTPTA